MSGVGSFPEDDPRSGAFHRTEFEDLYQRVRPHTKASRARVLAMYSALLGVDARGVAGDVVECGVWRGGHVLLARLVLPERVCWLYDTFAGMTAPGPHDRKRSGRKPPPEKALSRKWTAASREEVEQVMRSEGALDPDRLRFVVGDVLETLRREENLPKQIALLRLDTDWYESTRIELEVLYPRLVSGGVLIVDDYGHWAGARKAADDYFGGDVNFLEEIDYTGVMGVKP